MEYQLSRPVKKTRRGLPVPGSHSQIFVVIDSEGKRRERDIPIFLKVEHAPAIMSRACSSARSWSAVVQML